MPGASPIKARTDRALTVWVSLSYSRGRKFSKASIKPDGCYYCVFLTVCGKASNLSQSDMWLNALASALRSVSTG